MVLGIHLLQFSFNIMRKSRFDVPGDFGLTSMIHSNWIALEMQTDIIGDVSQITTNSIPGMEQCHTALVDIRTVGMKKIT